MISTEKNDSRRFGWLIALVLAVWSARPLLRGEPPQWPLLMGAAAVALAAAFVPGLLIWPYRGWMRLGAVLGGLTSAAILSVLYYLLVTPLGLLKKILGSGNTVFESSVKADSYWIPKQPGNPREDMRRLF